MVIGRASAYRRLLLDIKSEYDGVIREMKRREEEAVAFHLKSLLGYAAHITDRTLVLQNQTSELQQEVQRQKATTQSLLIPGLTVAQSEDPEVLLVHLDHLKMQRDDLLDRKILYGPVEVQTQLTFDLQEDQVQRDRLRAQHQQLMIRFRRLKLVGQSLTVWEESGQTVLLEELLRSVIQNLQEIGTDLQDEGGDEESFCIPAELLEEEEPTGLDESKLLRNHLDRLLDLLRSSQYEAAALHAARSPVLRDLDTMEMFRGVRAPPDSTPPLLLFFRALLVTAATGSRLSAAMSLRGVASALQQGDVLLIANAVTLNKLTFSEAVGDALTEHAQRNRGVADLCLALASTVYQACSRHQKTALSMCRRGLVHGAAEVIKRKKLTAEESLWVLSHAPSLSLLQLLTNADDNGEAAILSVGGTFASMLADFNQNQLALELLEGFLRRGPDVLATAILEDSRCSVDFWDQVAALCAELDRVDLSRAVHSILHGPGPWTSDLEEEWLMEHVFL
ncbi:clathrin heavy chain linker domain-containing protein 1-like isoform X2 [Poeciliopsis prolifica]|uniref:clathrin heavy chain linker domain-containing protein 1-like isoform X2 n=1 Tax=Poeciliopsis prolifica TaxID=188132 RepID=UPI0024142F1F|nr:clathrin heavy chain linker domain-containing protein 1-like isoform X2 [Poeciliopsis prolifica]XP_054880595.1 clathrin heavy chain linker domain-containing protein 1-like isoform X2 [Poeciliopsis prolifica]XP_054880596.1 clathrin heavy chain linker domain-containing protein 1-like isoform X2 [Poeciliopsis prolifica]